MPRAAAFVFVLALGTFGAACRVRTQLVVRVSTDMVQGAPDGELHAVRVVVRSATQAGRVFRDVQFDLGQGDARPFLPADLTLVRDASSISADVRVDVTAIGPRAGGAVGELFTRSVVTAYVDGRVSLVEIALLRDCAAVTCPAGQTCGPTGPPPTPAAGCVPERVVAEAFSALDAAARPDGPGRRDAQPIDALLPDADAALPDTPDAADAPLPDVADVPTDAPPDAAVCLTSVTLPAPFGTGPPSSATVVVRRNAVAGTTLALWSVRVASGHRLVASLVHDDGTAPMVLPVEMGSPIPAPLRMTDPDVGTLSHIRSQVVGSGFLTSWIQDGRPRVRYLEWTAAGRLIVGAATDPFGTATLPTYQDFFVTSPGADCTTTCAVLVCYTTSGATLAGGCSSYQWTARVGLSIASGFDSPTPAFPVDGVDIDMADAWSVLMRVDTRSFQHAVVQTDGTVVPHTPWPTGGLPQPLGLTSLPAVYVSSRLGFTPAQWVVPAVLGGAMPALFLYRQDSAGVGALVADLRMATGGFPGDRPHTLVYFPSARSWWLAWPQGTVVDAVTFRTIDASFAPARVAPAVGITIGNDSAGIFSAPIAESAGRLSGLAVVGYFSPAFAASVAFVDASGRACP